MEGHHGARQACLHIRPAPRPHLLAMADQRQHRAHRLDEQTVRPRATLTPLQGAGIPRRGLAAGVAQDHQALFALPPQPRKGVVCAMGRGTRPGDDHPPPAGAGDTGYPQQSSGEWRGLGGRSAGASGLRARGGSAPSHTYPGPPGPSGRPRRPGASPEAACRGVRAGSAPVPGATTAEGLWSSSASTHASPPWSACHRPKGTTARGQRRASGCVGRARLGSSTWANNAVIHSTVVMGSSVHGRVSRSCPVWRKCMTMARRSTSTIGL